MVYKIWWILGILNILLLLIAVIVIVWNKKMTTSGRVIRILEILILPILGPLMILIEVVSWKVKEENAEKRRQGIADRKREYPR